MSDQDLPSTLVEEYLQQKEKKNTIQAPQNDDLNATAMPSAELPPAKRQTVDEVLAEMKRVPLFMNSLDDMDEDNDQLAALRAIAYEGTRSEIAENFKTQGNELVQMKKWSDAREYYTKALQALKGPKQPQDPPEGTKVVEIDEEAEEKKERALTGACHANRALCHLELKNYGSCNRDCAAALRLNPSNVKAWYRAGCACLALDKLPEAQDACESGLTHDRISAPLQALSTRIQARQATLAALQHAREQAAQRVRSEQATLRHALVSRGIPTRHNVDSAPEMHDAAVALADPLDAASTLSLPVLFLYPLQAQSDMVKTCREDESLGEHLVYILPPPWDGKGEYVARDVECYMETTAGGLVKAGKNASLLRVLTSGKVEVVDGLVRVNVVPKAKASQWIEEFKVRRAKV